MTVLLGIIIIIPVVILLFWYNQHTKKEIEKEKILKETQVLKEPEQSSFDFSNDTIDVEFEESVRKIKKEVEIKEHYRSLGLDPEKMNSLGVKGSFGPQGMKGPISPAYSARYPSLPVDVDINGPSEFLEI